MCKNETLLRAQKLEVSLKHPEIKVFAEFLRNTGKKNLHFGHKSWKLVPGTPKLKLLRSFLRNMGKKNLHFGYRCWKLVSDTPKSRVFTEFLKKYG